MKEIIQKLKSITETELPGFYYEIEERDNSFTNGKYVKIVLAVSNHEINKVRGQYIQDVSLMLTDTMELYPQIFGGNGGQCIYKKPNMDDPKEKYLAMKSVKISFRRPKMEEKFVLESFKKFCKKYKQALKDNINDLMYRDIVNYESLLEG